MVYYQSRLSKHISVNNKNVAKLREKYTPENSPNLNDTFPIVKVDCYFSGRHEAERYENGIWYYQKRRTATNR